MMFQNEKKEIIQMIRRFFTSSSDDIAEIHVVFVIEVAYAFTSLGATDVRQYTCPSCIFHGYTCIHWNGGLGDVTKLCIHPIFLKIHNKSFN